MGAVVFDPKTRTGYSLFADRPIPSANTLRVGDRWESTDTMDFSVLLISGGVRAWVPQLLSGGVVFTASSPFKTDTGTDTNVFPQVDHVTGIVRIQAGNNTVVVVNSVVKATSILMLSIVGTPDATAKSFAWVIPFNGQFTITADQIATADVDIAFFVIETT